MEYLYIILYSVGIVLSYTYIFSCEQEAWDEEISSKFIWADRLVMATMAILWPYGLLLFFLFMTIFRFSRKNRVLWPKKFKM